MDDKIKRQAALYMLIKMVDENDGNLVINYNKVKRIFNDDEDIVKVEYDSGEVALLADTDFEIMNDIILNKRASI